jgi:hypothetical protein
MRRSSIEDAISITCLLSGAEDSPQSATADKGLGNTARALFYAASGGRSMSTRRSTSMGSGKMRAEFRSLMISAMVEQNAQVHGGGVALQPFRGVRRRLSGLVLTLGGDDLGAPVALGLGLAEHRASHGLGQLDVLDLDEGDLDAPGVGDVVDDPLEPLVHLVQVDQQLRQVDLAEDAAQGHLGDL